MAGRFEIVAHRLFAQRIVAIQQDHVRPHAQPRQLSPLLDERWRLAPVRIDHHRGDALRDVVLIRPPPRIRGAQSLGAIVIVVAVIVEVDEARRDDLAGGIDYPGCLDPLQIADHLDRVAHYAEVGAETLLARAIYDRATADDEVEGRRRAQYAGQ